MMTEIGPHRGMGRRAARSWLVGALVCCSLTYWHENGWGQEMDGQQRLPNFVLISGGPLQSIRDLHFSADSRRLYAAGFDKRVFEWTVLPGADGGLPVLAERMSLWWEVSRDRRGCIHTIAYSPQTREIAVAGFSARGQRGDVVILDEATREFVRVLPPVREEGRVTGHQCTVHDVAFSPDGKQLASIDYEGQVRVWSADRAWSSQVLSPPDGQQDERRRVAFLSQSQVLFTRLKPHSPGPGLDGEVVLADLSGQQPSLHPLSPMHEEGVLALAVAAGDDPWASSDGVGKVRLWSGGRTVGTLSLRTSQHSDNRVAASLSFGRPGQLLVNSLATLGDGRIRASLELWDTTRRTRLDALVLSEGLPAFAAALSPDGRLAAGVDGNTHAVQVYGVNDQGRFVRSGGNEPSVCRLAGSGGPLYHVAFADDDSGRLGFSRDPQLEVREGFDLKNIRLLNPVPPAVRWRTSRDSSGEWKLPRDRVTREGDRQILRLHRRDLEQCRVELDARYQGLLRSYCWIPDEQGRCSALAVGTERNHIFVFGLAGQGVCPLLRYFRDHVDMVTSLSASSDRRYLASASMDGMIKIWSLEGLQTRHAAFRGQTAWGAVFSITDGRLVVSEVSPAGIAASRGLRQGDIVTAYTKTVGDGLQTYDTPQGILAAIEATVLWDQVLFKLSRNGQDRLIRLVPGWEPLLSLFVDRRHEWAVWTPRGYYDSSVNGDKLFGWLVNGDQGQTPRFFQGKQFREDLEKPDVIRQLLASGNVDRALQAAGIALEKQQDALAVAEQVPQLRIVEPRNGAELVANAKARLVARVEYPQGRPADYQVLAIVNGVELGPARVLPRGGAFEYEWDFVPAAKNSRVKVRVQRGGDLARALHVEDTAYYVSAVKSSPRRLHVVGLAANEYGGSLKLKWAVGDVAALTEVLRQNSGVHFTLAAEPDMLLERDLSRAGVERLFARLQTRLQAVSPSDLLVVIVSGHGVAIGSEFYFLPPDSRLATISPRRSQDLELIKTVGIPWSLFRTLTAIPCQKVFLLDACQSGAAAVADRQDRNVDWKAAVRPLDAVEAMVIAAAAADESARELPTEKHGCFTLCWLRALEGKADGYPGSPAVPAPDGNVDLAEAIRYVEQEVPKLFPFQHPTFSPLELSSFVSLPLVRVGSAKK